ncbi:hypothetical protein BJX99DRAFT_112893 [Aspergillus californicus]
MQPEGTMDTKSDAHIADDTKEASGLDLQSSPIDEMTPGSVALPEPVTSQKLIAYSDRNTLDDNMQVAAQDSGYNSSGSSSHQSPGEALSDTVEDGGLIRTRSRASSRTSISSIPASVLTNLPDGMKPMSMRDSHDYMSHPWDNYGPRPVHTLRQREAMFRKPSSVRAMQMHTEDEGDDEFLTPPKRRGSHRTSDISIRSAGSSPLKRSPFYSPTGAVSKPKVKKEYPLVLLHCTLLAPSLPIPGLIGHPDRQKYLREVLPAVYWKRWKLLEEKIGSGVLRDRGVLISHPEDMYDLLEERLLESLELQHPRLDHGHFIGRDETDSDREDRLETEDSSTDDEGDECPDCGGRVMRHNTNRKWEIKVFAANGLMRAGAWAAAWKEMEKVDVEVGLSLPPDIRAELERKLVENASRIDNGLPVPLLQEPEDLTAQDAVCALISSTSRADTAPRVTHEKSLSPTSSRVNPSDNQTSESRAPKSDEIDLQTLLVNYIRVLASDRRNVTIVFLSILVMFVALNSRSATFVSDLEPSPWDMHDYTASSMVVLHEQASPTWGDNTISETLPVAILDSTGPASTPSPEIISDSEDYAEVSDEGLVIESEPILPMVDDASSTGNTQVIEELSSATAETSSVVSTETSSEEVPLVTEVGKAYVQRTELSEELSEELSPPPVEEPEIPVNTADNLEELSAAIAEAPVAENTQDDMLESPEELEELEDLRQANKSGLPVADSVSPTVSMEDDQALPTIAHQHEQVEQVDAGETNEQNVPREPNEQDEENDEI